MDEGLKHDDGKLRYDLVPVEGDEAIARALTYGANKYADRNWELGLDWGRVYAAAQRHLKAFWKGEDFDSESGLHHLDHALCNLVMLRTYYERSIGTDSREV